MHTIQTITLEEAQERLMACVHPVMPEKVGLLESIDRILASGLPEGDRSCLCRRGDRQKGTRRRSHLDHDRSDDTGRGRLCCQTGRYGLRRRGCEDLSVIGQTYQLLSDRRRFSQRRLPWTER